MIDGKEKNEQQNQAPEEIELIHHRAMIEIPENAVEIELRCRVYQDGGLINVSRTLSISDIREACRKADDGYIDDDDRFVLTDFGQKFAEENGLGDH